MYCGCSDRDPRKSLSLPTYIPYAPLRTYPCCGLPSTFNYTCLGGLFRYVRYSSVRATHVRAHDGFISITREHDKPSQIIRIKEEACNRERRIEPHTHTHTLTFKYPIRAFIGCKSGAAPMFSPSAAAAASAAVLLLAT